MYDEECKGMVVFGCFARARIGVQFRVSVRPSPAGWFSVPGNTFLGRRHAD